MASGSPGSHEQQERVRAAIRKQKWTFRTFWQRVQYKVCGGAGVGVVLLAGIITWFRPEQRLVETLVNDETRMAAIRSFTPRASSNFKGWTIGEVQEKFGGIFWTNAIQHVPTCHPHSSGRDIPERYNLKDEWNFCFSPPYKSGKCSSSWATVAASMTANRFCMANPDKYRGLRLSPQDLLSCDTMNAGCAGGAIDAVWRHIRKKGIVTEQCFPYEGNDTTVQCGNKCRDPNAVHFTNGFCRVSDEFTAKLEIMTNGPILAILPLWDDFLVYGGGGVYQPDRSSRQLHDANKRTLTHAVKIIGWGEEDDVPYWIIENNFGTTWGIKGYAKVIRGDSKLVLENAMMSVEVMDVDEDEGLMKTENVENDDAALEGLAQAEFVDEGAPQQPAGGE